MTSTSPYPIPKQLRQSDIFLGDGGATYSGFNFKIFDVDDVEVWTLPQGADRFARLYGAVIAKANGLPFDDFTVTCPENQPVTTKIIVLSARLDSRDAGVIKGTCIDPTALEKEFSKIATEMQEARRDIGRALLSDFGQPQYKIANDLQDGDLLAKSGSYLVKGLNVSDFTAVQGDLAAETAARIAGDAALDTRIDGLIDSVSEYADQAAASAAQSEASSILARNAEAHAVELVQEATAGFTGWPDGTILDLGRVTEANHYFNQNWGRVTDA